MDNQRVEFTEYAPTFCLQE